MTSAPRLEVTLLPGAQELLAEHARELPQRDDLCGAFCGALALHAAGVVAHRGEPVDQDAVALAAGSVISSSRDGHALPHGEPGRRDYRLPLPAIADPALSGTTAGGVVRALEAISEGRVRAIPVAGPFSEETLAGLFDLAAALEHPAALIANLATRHLWGADASPSALLEHALSGRDEGPPPDWDVGHFVCVVARVRGPGGSLYALADTYPALGAQGVHMQPAARLAKAIERRDMPAGGVIAAVLADDAPALRAGIERLGMREEIWDNGTAAPGAPQAQALAPGGPLPRETRA
jgi:hypothetical protein